MTPPTIEEFIDYAKEICKEDGYDFKSIEKSVRSKYRAWKEAGWKKQKNGKFIPIKIWKSTLSNTLPYLKAERIEVKEPTTITEKLIYGQYNNN